MNFQTYKVDEKIMDESKSWSNLPMDILELIALRLDPEAHQCYACVCKRWLLSSYIIYPSHTCPVLMHFQTRGSLCHYYNPIYHMTFTINSSLDLSRVKFLFAKDGWLLLLRGEFEMFLVNPFSESLHEIPSLKETCMFDGFAFSCPPTSPDFIIFCIDSSYDDCVSISIFRGGEWSSSVFHLNDVDFLLSFANPVFHHGLFYCLGTKGNLGVFDPNENTWCILRKPQQLCTSGRDRGFLVESDGDLLSIFIGDPDKPVRVYRLNQANMIWERVESLGNQTLFVGYPMSLSIAAPLRGMKNKIYIDRVCGDPEIVEAQVRHSGVHMNFMPLTQRDQSKKESNKDNIPYTIGSHIDESLKDFKYKTSIWIEPKFV